MGVSTPMLQGPAKKEIKVASIDDHLNLSFECTDECNTIWVPLTTTILLIP